MATRRHGFINYVDQVHDLTARETARNFFGANSLGKSNIAVYSSLFVHEDSPNATNESDLVKKHYTNRRLHVDSAGAADHVYNPDFPQSSFSYNYSGNTGIQKISFNRGEIELNEALQIAYLQPADSENSIIEGRNTYTFTPSLSVTTDFNGGDLQDSPPYHSITREDANSTGGGFGSDVRFNQDSDADGAFQDVHEITEYVTDGRENSYVKPGSEGVKESYLFTHQRYSDVKPSGI